MKQDSFIDILIDKISSQKTDRHLETSDLDFREYISPLFQVQHTKPTTDLLKKYSPTIKPPSPIHSDSALKTPLRENEYCLSKKTLNSDETSTWNLFEKILDIKPSEQYTRQSIMKAFRRYAKLHHPDTTPNSSPQNFAYLVRVKNEMLALFEKKKSLFEKPI